MNSNLKLSKGPYSESNEILRNTLDTTSDQIGNHFNNLFNRSEEIDNARKNSNNIVNLIAEREASVANYAQQLVELKTQFEEDKKNFENDIRIQQESIENVIVEVSKKLYSIQTISVEITNKLSIYSQEKAQINQKIEDYHGMDNDLMKEEKEINNRIEILERNLNINEQQNTSLEIKKAKEDITATSLMIENLKKNLTEILKKHQTFQDNNQIVNQKVQQIESKISKAKKSDENNLLQRSLTVQTEEFKLVDFQNEENKKKLNELKQSIQNSKEKMKTIKENENNFKKNSEHRQNRFKLNKDQIKEAKDEARQMDKLVKIMKQCKTMNEFKVLKKVLETKKEKDEVLRNIGEIRVKNKDNLRMIPIMEVKLNNYERKIENSNKIDNEIQNVDSKIKKKNNKIQSELDKEKDEFLSGLETLEQINHHIAFSEKVGEDLISHKFFEGNPDNQELKEKYKKMEHKFQEKIDEIKKETKRIQKQIDKAKSVRQEQKKLLNCPNFSHPTKIDADNNNNLYEKLTGEVNNKILGKPDKFTVPFKNKNDIPIERLQGLVYLHQRNIQKRRLNVIERKNRLQNVCDFYNDPKFSNVSLDSFMFCNGLVNLFNGKRIRSYDELFKKFLSEKERLKNSSSITPPMLVFWYDELERMF